MDDIVIRVENLSKMYRIGKAQERHTTLRDALVAGLSARLESLWRRDNRASHGRDQDALVWAVKDVSFEVLRGEVVGIIGRNGAGKSTLLKILSRITEPTEGRAEIHGRVGSLLEVGTGFHPELTGRENVYLNGAILGMRRAEIDRKFDEIVAFSEIEKFLDTPVKRYSSGMYVRLAFAVAAHLDPEILVVDEVLSVGDAEFQKKCLGKMQDVSTGGRTVLFVSHNMSAVQRLCSRTILLKDGRLDLYGETGPTVVRYLSTSSPDFPPANWLDLAHASRTGTRRARFTQVWYQSDDAEYGLQPYPNGPLLTRLGIQSDSDRSVSSIAVTLYDQTGNKLVNADSSSLGRVVRLSQGYNEIRLTIRNLHLNPGVYVLGLWLANPPGEVFDCIHAGANIEIRRSECAGFGIQPASDGVVACQLEIAQPEPSQQGWVHGR